MKQSNKEKLQARLENALQNLYHNATPNYPDTRNDYEADQFEGWFGNERDFAIECLGESDRQQLFTKTAKGNTYRFCTRSMGPVAWFIDNYVSTNKRGIYQWGRGGRTLAPSCMISQRGGSGFTINDQFGADYCTAEKVTLIKQIEAFNAEVEAWNKGIAQAWRDYLADEPELGVAIAEHDGKRKRVRQFTEYV